MFTVIVIVIIILIILGNIGNSSNNSTPYDGPSNQGSSVNGNSATGSSNYSATAQNPLYQVQGGVIKDIRVNKTRTGHYQYWLTVATTRGRFDFSKFIEANADADLYMSLRKGDVVNFTYVVSKGQYLDIKDLEKVGHRLFG